MTEVARHRRGERGVIITELLFLCASAWSIFAASSISKMVVKWHQEMPVSWLLYESHLPMTETAVSQELCRRSDTLTNEEITLIAMRALELQRDRQRRFDHEWGDIIESAQHDDLLAARLWEQYVQQVVVQNVKLRVPAEVRRGQPMEIELVRPRMTRTGWALNIAGAGSYRLFLDDKDITQVARQETGMAGRVWVGLEACQLESVPEQWSVPTGKEVLEQIDSRPHKLRLKASLEIEDCQDAHPEKRRRVSVDLTVEAEVALSDASK
jgi:hypothetical protein